LTIYKSHFQIIFFADIAPSYGISVEKFVASSDGHVVNPELSRRAKYCTCSQENNKKPYHPGYKPFFTEFPFSSAFVFLRRIVTHSFLGALNTDICC